MRLNNCNKILVVDDDLGIVQDIKQLLLIEGYKVEAALNGRQAVEIALHFKPHLVLMDVAMPVMDGIEACIEMRAVNSIKKMLIVFYTDRNEDYSQIAGFNAGADDYIIKPVKPKVLLTRIRVLLKRLNGTLNELQVNEKSTIKIDRERYVVIKNGEEIAFPRKEFELLSLLYSSPRKVFTRNEISNLIWGYEIVSANRTIDVHIRKLREKLGNNCIKTVKGIGYSFAS
ncbi:MAG: response regulator transcription factor [Bacteroidetes bacterium]|nr:response regulator transcription factor [Bacteroidota bacterium]